MATALYISTDELVKHSVLNGNVDHSKLIPAIKAVQEIELHPLLGTDLYNRISEDIISDSVTGDYLTLKNSYIHPFLVHAATAYYIPFASYTIQNSGIGKNNGGDNRDPLTLQEVTYMSNKEENVAEMYKERLIDYLCEHSTWFPEYSTNTGADIHPSKETNQTNWYLGPDDYDLDYDERNIDHD